MFTTINNIIVWRSVFNSNKNTQYAYVYVYMYWHVPYRPAFEFEWFIRYMKKCTWDKHAAKRIHSFRKQQRAHTRCVFISFYQVRFRVRIHAYMCTFEISCVYLSVCTLTYQCMRRLDVVMWFCVCVSWNQYVPLENENSHVCIISVSCIRCLVCGVVVAVCMSFFTKHLWLTVDSFCRLNNWNRIKENQIRH